MSLIEQYVDRTVLICSSLFKNRKKGDNPLAFRWWTRKGVWFVYELLATDGINPFTYLRGHWQLPFSVAYRYLQITQYICSLLCNCSGPPKCLISFERRCGKDPHCKGLVSDLYASFVNSMYRVKLPYVAKWEEDLGTSLDQAAWNSIWFATSKCSLNFLAHENAFRLLSRWTQIYSLIRTVLNTF